MTINYVDLLIIAVLLLLGALALRSILRSRRSGCAGCAYAKSCSHYKTGCSQDCPKSKDEGGCILKDADTHEVD